MYNLSAISNFKFNMYKKNEQFKSISSILIFFNMLEKHIRQLYEMNYYDTAKYSKLIDLLGDTVNCYIRYYNEIHIDTPECNFAYVINRMFSIIEETGLPNIDSIYDKNLDNNDFVDFLNLSCIIVSVKIKRKRAQKCIVEYENNSLCFPFGKIICVTIGNLKIKYMPLPDSTNIIYKSAKLTCKFISINKTKLEYLSYNYPRDKRDFIIKLFKNYNQLFCFVSEDLSGIINYYYSAYLNVSQNINSHVIECINYDKNDMFEKIMILSCGNTEDIYNAGILFNLIDKSNLKKNAELIFKFLPQKIRKEIGIYQYYGSSQINEYSHNLNIEDLLSIKKNIPENVKQIIRDNKQKSDEPKISLLIQALLDFPWKPKKIEHQSYINSNNNDICNSNIPFKKTIKNKFALRQKLLEIKKTLDEDVYGHEDMKTCMIELVAKWFLTNNTKGDTIGLCGPPGVGKTLIAKSLGRALDLPIETINLGGMSDSAELVGHSFTYHTSQYGSIVRSIIKMGKWRNIIYFDELDKITPKNNISEIYNILIHLTDPFSEFKDRFFPSTVSFDLSGTLFIFSYNDRTKIDNVLLDRIKEIKIEPYDINDKINLSYKFFQKEWDLSEIKNFQNNISREVIEYVIDNYTKEPGVRELKRLYEKIFIKSKLDEILLNTESDCIIDIPKIHKYLGKPQYSKSYIQNCNPGRIFGMSVDNYGVGGLTELSVAFTSGHGMFTTGNQKKIMEESIKCALTFCLNYFKINELPSCLHVHAGNFSIPKDGSSAGLAFGLCILSLLTGINIDSSITATGEMDISGNINSVGSIHEKIKVAINSGLTIIIVPLNNIIDYNKIPENSQTKIHQVSHISECFELVFGYSKLNLKKEYYLTQTAQKIEKNN